MGSSTSILSLSTPNANYNFFPNLSPAGFKIVIIIFFVCFFAAVSIQLQPKRSACALRWTEISENKQMCCVFVEKKRVKSRTLPMWSEFKRLHIREFKPKHDKIDCNSLVNLQQTLGHECLLSTVVNLVSKGNCYSDLFPDVLSCVSDRVFPARENVHRFSRWAEVMGTHPPALVLQLCSALNWGCDGCAD